jgi:hypothetical protein
VLLAEEEPDTVVVPAGDAAALAVDGALCAVAANDRKERHVTKRAERSFIYRFSAE